MEIPKYLVICSLPKNDDQVKNFVGTLQQNNKLLEMIYTEDYKLRQCTGCNSCWLKTPGKCVIKDDFELIFKKFLKAHQVILLTEAKMGFISYKMKGLIDRFIALDVPYTRVYKGEMRHVNRYEKSWDIALIYKGEGDQVYLNEWMERFTLNFHSKSLGAMSLEAWEGKSL